ncbi:hypothetical protein SAMN05421743_101182 [Thalassobacillus cyri]|uniref:Pyrrolidone-carboxylate peptidase (N-terminal pyroglutamyl peptidase) n=1 Tax=Thalassobacillus cyri TaxID=571932 RepID=A0A1H3VU87_9BACI|nr:hypothetical protein [Thalassobacillus cyri]SDZ78310.1 hypothetical protein SAMN05421743_101182 [Thalassobacillus cyri]
MKLSNVILTWIVILIAGFGTTSFVNAESHCYNEDVPLTPEEQRMEDGAPIPQQIMNDAEFTQFAEIFEERLCKVNNVDQAEKLISTHGEQLWDTAIARAQGKRPDLGDLDRYDDRPLYWTRLHMTSALRQWEPEFSISEAERNELMKELEYTSRGITSIDYPKGKKVKRILVTGFDPYRLEQEFRRSNPSGAAALQLDGKKVMTEDGPAFIQAANFPVRWEDFEEGIVEDTFGPYLEESKEQVDLMMTISQGGPRVMAIEGFAGRWHTGVGNNLEERSSVIPTVGDWLMPDELPEFIETTLPVEEMVNADTGPWPVERNDEVCEWLAPGYRDAAYVCQDNGPTEDSKARAGGGGSYLSNESQYRSNRVRIGLGAYDIPGGHLHVAAQEHYPEDTSVYITDEFMEFRMDTVEQTFELVKAAANAVDK